MIGRDQVEQPGGRLVRLGALAGIPDLLRQARQRIDDGEDREALAVGQLDGLLGEAPRDAAGLELLGHLLGVGAELFLHRPGDDACEAVPPLIASGGKRLETSDTIILGDDVIHQVSNPVPKLTGAIHVYGGDFLTQPHSQWGDPPYAERPWEMGEAREQFAAANAAWRASMT